MIKNIFLASLLVIFFSACSIKSSFFSSTDYNDLVKDAITNSKSFTILQKSDIVVVTDFVNVKTLENNSNLGFLLSSALKNQLSNNYGSYIKEVELRKRFLITQKGLLALSRQLRNIKEDMVDVKYAAVGTYSITSEQLIIFVKLIDIETGLIVASTTNSVSITEETKKLDFPKQKKEENNYPSQERPMVL